MTESDPSVRETDGLVNSPSPEKKTGTPPRNVQDIEQCYYCQDNIPLGSVCPRCGVTRKQGFGAFHKYVRSD